MALRALLSRLPEGDLWRDRTYGRLWLSILTSSFAGQVMLLALPLTAAVLLKASPTQMGTLTAIELSPFLTIGTALYVDRYLKVDGRWQIRETRYRRIYEIGTRLDKAPRFFVYYLGDFGTPKAG